MSLEARWTGPASPTARLIVCSLMLLAMLVLLISLTGCSNRKLFPRDAARSPFSRYDALRGQEPQMYVDDEFGREIPNLRARLSPR